MRRAELDSILAKAASAGRSSRRAALLKRAFIQAEQPKPAVPPSRGGTMQTFGFGSTNAVPGAAAGPSPKTPEKAVGPAPAAADPRAELDRMGRDFLLSGRNLVTNPIDTMRRYFNRKPLKR